ncbi:MAG TPA: pentapeptide repeat-containing protein [Blastocatellia bacterium]|nr:pentapeptide repeat-containing protein [Blastocatellia bacterium]
MTASFPGTFAGKMTFFSAQPSGPNFYLTTNRISDGHHGWIYWPGMNATSVSQTEKFILYIYDDGYYRIQSGDLRWLMFDESAGFIQYSDDPAQAASFLIQGNPFGSQLSLHTAAGDQQIFYMLQSSQQVPNVLGITGGQGHYGAFVPTVTTPSLETIRQQKKAASADFTNVLLTGQDLSQGIDFTGAHFVGAQLAGVNFTGATLDRADLSQTDLRGLNWGSPASAAGIILSNSNASGCQLGGQATALDCSKANLSSAILIGTQLAGLNLPDAILSGAVLNGAILDGAVLNRANMNGVVALGASFIGAVLTDASGQMGIFSRAVFDNANLTKVHMGASSFLFNLSATFAAELDQFSFPQQDLLTAFANNGITLSPSSPIDVVIKGQRWLIEDPSGPYKLLLTSLGIQVFNDNPSLIPAILQGASFKGVVGSTASLSGADLRGVRWYAAPATLDHADLEDAAFTGALLVSTDFTQANVSGVDFSNTVLIQGKFIGCIAGPGGNRRAISFEGAHLEGVDFSKATFAGAILTDAVVGLDQGVPLLFLPLESQQYLNNAGITTLTPVFRKGGFDLGSSPVVTDNSSWNIDNSQCTAPAPKLYNVQNGDGGFLVFGDGVSLFSLPSSVAPLLNQPQASPPLVNLFKSNQYALATGAPITKLKAWTITPSQDAGYLRPYLFPTLSVQAESGRLSVFGLPPVFIENLPQYPNGVAFNATQKLQDALSPNAVGPAGVPFSWISAKLIDSETFFTAL